MGNILAGLLIVAILSGAILKIIIEKRKGAKCIGCPYSKTKSSNCNCSGNN